AFVDIQNSFDCHITVRMRPELPARSVGFLPIFIQFLFARGESSIVILRADIWPGKPCCASRNRSVGDLLHSPDAHPFVAESGTDARFNHLVDAFRADKTIDAHSKIAGIVGVLISLKIQWTYQRIAHGRDSRL